MARFIPPAPTPVPKGWRRLNDSAVERLTRYESARVAVWKTSRGKYRTTVTVEPFATQELAMEVAATLFGAKTNQQQAAQIADELLLAGWAGTRIDAERAAKLALRVIRRPLPDDAAGCGEVDHVGALLRAGDALYSALNEAIYEPECRGYLVGVATVWMGAHEAVQKEREGL